jgi:ATP-dependent Clp protease ATP-binding subunit ClpA
MQSSQNLELVLGRAKDFAQQFQHTHVSPLHLLLALLKTPECQGYKHLENQQVPIQKLSDYISHNRLNHEPYGTPTGHFNSRSKFVLSQSAQIARQMGSAFTRTAPAARFAHRPDARPRGIRSSAFEVKTHPLDSHPIRVAGGDGGSARGNS